MVNPRSNSGVLFETKKFSATSPDWRGKLNIDIDGEPYVFDIVAWEGESETGTRYVSIRVGDANKRMAGVDLSVQSKAKPSLFDMNLIPEGFGERNKS